MSSNFSKYVFFRIVFLKSCLYVEKLPDIFWSSRENMHKAVKAFSLCSNASASAVKWHCLNSVFKEGKKELISQQKQLKTTLN